MLLQKIVFKTTGPNRIYRTVNHVEFASLISDDNYTVVAD